MNRKLVIVIGLVVGVAILLFSFSVRKSVLKRGARLVDELDSEHEERLLNLSRNYTEKKDYVKAKETLKEFMKQFPDSKDAANAQKIIEELNIKILFSDIVTEDSLSYKIKPADTLAKIASKFNTTVELLKKSNNLKTDLILPGKLLKVNKETFRIVVDISENVLALEKSNAETVKRYLVSTGENQSTPTGTFKIEEKLISPVWYKIGAIVEPESQEYELGSRWMGLSVSGYGIHGTKDTSTIGRHITKGCIRMKDEDIEELYAIVPSGTEVTIVE